MHFHYFFAAFAGVMTPYYGQSALEDTNLIAPCNIDCNCSDSDFSPVCGDDRVTYFSACFAGCNAHESVGNFYLLL